MTHEQFLGSLIGPWNCRLLQQEGENVACPPLTVSGRDEADAIARWLVGEIMVWIRHSYGTRFQQDVDLSIRVFRAWKYWRRDGEEDVDFVVSVLRQGRTPLRERVKVRVVRESRTRYRLRITDWISDPQGRGPALPVDVYVAAGTQVVESSSRIRIDRIERPQEHRHSPWGPRVPA